MQKSNESEKISYPYNLRSNFFPVSILKEKLLEKRLNTLELYSKKNKLINSKIPFNEQWECKDFLKRK